MMEARFKVPTITHTITKEAEL